MNGYMLYYGEDNEADFIERVMNDSEYQPICEAFKYRKNGDDNLVKEKHFISEEFFDEDLFEEIPDNLFEALNVEANAKSLNV